MKGPVETLALSVPFRVVSCCFILMYVVQLAVLVDDGSFKTLTLVDVQLVRHSKFGEPLFHLDLGSYDSRMVPPRNCNTVLHK